MSPSTISQKADKLRAPPLKVLDNDVARLYTHIHPFLVLSGYFISFQSIVEDPVRSLFGLILPFSVLQVVYVVLCLPPTGTALSTSGQKGGHKKGSKSLGLGSKIIPAIISLTLSLLFGTPLLTLILILFGAPLTTHLPQTLLCAAHLSLLTSLPLIYSQGVDTERWKQIAALALPIDEVFGAALGGCLGAWVGAVPIPLDWDREWQKWPVTILTGGYIGWAVGKGVGGLVLRGRSVDLGP